MRIHFVRASRHSAHANGNRRRARVAKLNSAIDTQGKEFRANATAMRALVKELDARRAQAALGGPERSRARHVARGKLLPRERVLRLLDPGTPFLELSPLA